jgi:four helix bundle protein
MRDFRELTVWGKAHQLTLDLYPITAGFPRVELYGIGSQMRRAAASIGANIAEGAMKSSKPEFARYLEIALGSAGELEYHLLLSKDLGFLNAPQYLEMSERVREVKRMLTGLIQHLRSKGRAVS